MGAWEPGFGAQMQVGGEQHRRDGCFFHNLALLDLFGLEVGPPD